MKNYVKVGYAIDCGTSYSLCKVTVEAINHETSLQGESAIPMVIEQSPSGRWIISPVYSKDIKQLQRIWKIIDER